MEFLAESIGLLDLYEEEARAKKTAAYSLSSPAASSQQRGGEQQILDSEKVINDHATTNEDGNSSIAATPPSRSFSLFPSWRSAGSSGEGLAGVGRDKDDGCCSSSPSAPVNTNAKISGKQKHPQGDSDDDDVTDSNGLLLGFPTRKISSNNEDVQQEEELGASGLSLLSSLTPGSPMTLSSSSLNLISSPSKATTPKATDRKRHNTNTNINGSSSCIYCNDPDLYMLCECNNWRGSKATILSTPSNDADDNNGSSEEVDDNGNSNSIPASAASMPQSAPEINTNHCNTTTNNTLTKFISQRIDTRTNHNCFTGTIDAITGQLLHGTMIYRSSGEVYTGPFITTTNFNNNNVEGAVRHGKNATCQYSNGVKFVGCFEFDLPTLGVWSSSSINGNEGEEDGWRYEGATTVMQDDAYDSNNGNAIQNSSNHGIYNNAKYNGTSVHNQHKASSIPSFSSSSSNGRLSALDTSFTTALHHNGTYHCNFNSSIMGIPPHTLLPGSLVFTGNGKFTRYRRRRHCASNSENNGIVLTTTTTMTKVTYNGEFVNGLANGVGKQEEEEEETTTTTSITIDDSNNEEQQQQQQQQSCCSKSVYYGEFMNGLRHGVGTLVEDIFDDQGSVNEFDGEEYCCDCQLINQHNTSEGEHDTTDVDVGNVTLNDPSDVGTSINVGQTPPPPSIDTGPDFAAGFSTTAPAPAANATPLAAAQIEESNCNTNSNAANKRRCKTCQQPILSKQQSQQEPKQKQKKQRYSSGVWCANQYEITDVRGIVSSDTNEFIQEGGGKALAVTSDVSSTTTTTEIGDSVRGGSGGTTWDMLDEKWLGI